MTFRRELQTSAAVSPITLTQTPVIRLSQIPVTGAADNITTLAFFAAVLAASGAAAREIADRYHGLGSPWLQDWRRLSAYGERALAGLFRNRGRRRSIEAAVMTHELTRLCIERNVWLPLPSLHAIASAAGGDPRRARLILRHVLAIAATRTPAEAAAGMISAATVDAILKTARPFLPHAAA